MTPIVLSLDGFPSSHERKTATGATRISVVGRLPRYPGPEVRCLPIPAGSDRAGFPPDRRPWPRSSSCAHRVPQTACSPWRASERRNGGAPYRPSDPPSGGRIHLISDIGRICSGSRRRGRRRAGREGRSTRSSAASTSISRKTSRRRAQELGLAASTWEGGSWLVSWSGSEGAVSRG